MVVKGVALMRSPDYSGLIMIQVRERYTTAAMGRAIRELRGQRRLTLAELARAAHTTPAVISNVERGVSGASMDMLINIAVALDLSADPWEALSKLSKLASKHAEGGEPG